MNYSTVVPPSTSDLLSDVLLLADMAMQAKIRALTAPTEALRNKHWQICAEFWRRAQELVDDDETRT